MKTSMPLGARVVALTALLWNLLALVLFVLRVAITPEQAAALPPAQQAIDVALPLWVDGMFGIAAVAGTAGSIPLLLARRWAPPMLLLAFVALAVQLLAGYLLAPVWRATGAGGVLMSALLLLVVGAVWGFAREARRRGWLR